jgi:hypothetical protein
MKNPNEVIKEMDATVKKSLDEILSSQSSPNLNADFKLKILNNVNKAFERVLGKEEFERFCNYLNSRGITLYIENQGYNLLVCFYNNIVHLKISEVVNDYYESLLQIKK